MAVWWPGLGARLRGRSVLRSGVSFRDGRDGMLVFIDRRHGTCPLRAIGPQLVGLVVLARGNVSRRVRWRGLYRLRPVNTLFAKMWRGRSLWFRLRGGRPGAVTRLWFVERMASRRTVAP